MQHLSFPSMTDDPEHPFRSHIPITMKSTALMAHPIMHSLSLIALLSHVSSPTGLAALMRHSIVMMTT